MRAGLWLWIVVTLLTGCATPTSSSDLSRTSESIPTRPLVIAIIDTGTSPYLSTFASDLELTPEIAAMATPYLAAQEGDLADRLARDDPFWENATPGVLYHFTGTRLLAITFTDAFPRALFDSIAHGAYVTQVAARDAPSAIIVSIQIDAELAPPPSLFDASVAEAMEWVADQAWIDVVSVSLGVAGNPPTSVDHDPVAARWLAASERAARDGKIIIGASGNTVAPPLMHFTTGAPWVIDVGGVETGQHGDKPNAAKGVDVVSDFNVLLLHAGDFNETIWRGGTSFAAPAVAGTIASALDEIRRISPSRVVATQEIRDALNATAIYFNATDWRPIPPAHQDPARDLLRFHSAPILLQAQMGWGYVNASFAPEIARRVVEGDYAIPPGKEQAEAVQPLWQQAREEYWSRTR